MMYNGAEIAPFPASCFLLDGRRGKRNAPAATVCARWRRQCENDHRAYRSPWEVSSYRYCWVPTIAHDLNSQKTLSLLYVPLPGGLDRPADLAGLSSGPAGAVEPCYDRGYQAGRCREVLGLPERWRGRKCHGYGRTAGLRAAGATGL